jgi:hypothetical protein
LEGIELFLDHLRVLVGLDQDFRALILHLQANHLRRLFQVERRLKQVKMELAFVPSQPGHIAVILKLADHIPEPCAKRRLGVRRYMPEL